MNNNFPFKYILNRDNIKNGSIINIECMKKKKKIKITEKRKVFANEELDYTCIEILKSDSIKNYFKIDQFLFQYNKEIFKYNDIFILQYPNGNDISFSSGKILFLNNNKIFHNASTEDGSSGSPIIRRSKENYVIGLHFGGIKKNENFYFCNLATPFDLIINDIKGAKNEINCIS